MRQRALRRAGAGAGAGQAAARSFLRPKGSRRGRWSSGLEKRFAHFLVVARGLHWLLLARSSPGGAHGSRENGKIAPTLSREKQETISGLFERPASAGEEHLRAAPSPPVAAAAAAAAKPATAAAGARQRRTPRS